MAVAQNSVMNSLSAPRFSSASLRSAIASLHELQKNKNKATKTADGSLLRNCYAYYNFDTDLLIKQIPASFRNSRVIYKSVTANHAFDIACTPYSVVTAKSQAGINKCVKSFSPFYRQAEKRQTWKVIRSFALTAIADILLMLTADRYRPARTLKNNSKIVF